MASGNTHEAFGKALATITIPASVALLGVPPFPVVLGQLTALFIASPDVDTRSNSTKRWGLLDFIWKPLQSSTHHRGITHHPIAGPFVVMGYLTGFVIAVINGARIMIAHWSGVPFSFWFPSFRFEWIAWFMAAVFVQYWLHLILDFVSSWWKQFRKGKRRRKNGEENDHIRQRISDAVEITIDSHDENNHNHNHNHKRNH